MNLLRGTLVTHDIAMSMDEDASSWADGSDVVVCARNNGAHMLLPTTL